MKYRNLSYISTVRYPRTLQIVHVRLLEKMQFFGYFWRTNRTCTISRKARFFGRYFTAKAYFLVVNYWTGVNLLRGTRFFWFWVDWSIRSVLIPFYLWQVIHTKQNPKVPELWKLDIRNQRIKIVKTFFEKIRYLTFRPNSSAVG